VLGSPRGSARHFGLEFPAQPGRHALSGGAKKVTKRRAHLGTAGPRTVPVRSDLAGLSTPFHKYDHVCCVDFRFWRGATREHPPQWGCDRGATKPEPKSDATLRAAVLFGPDVVAHSLQTPEGYARVPVRKHLAPRLGQKSLSANVVVFMERGTKPQRVEQAWASWHNPRL